MVRRIRSVIRRILKKLRLRLKGKTIYYQGKRHYYGHPLRNDLFVAIFKAIQNHFGQKMAGFYDFRRAQTCQPSEMEKLVIQAHNPPGREAVNFLQRLMIETETVRSWHTALSHFNPLWNNVLVYEPGARERKSEICLEYLEWIVLYHGESPAVSHVKHFAVQDDFWSCTMVSIFALVCVLAQEDPTHFKFKRRGTFRLAKMAVERGGRALVGKTIGELLNLVGKKLDEIPRDMDTSEEED